MSATNQSKIVRNKVLVTGASGLLGSPRSSRARDQKLNNLSSSRSGEHG
jgi:hypothetical protein